MYYWGHKWLCPKGTSYYVAKTFQNIFLINHIEHRLGKEIQICSNEVPRVMYGSGPGA